MLDLRRARAIITVLLVLALPTAASWGQALPRDAATAGFAAVSGKRMAPFAVRGDSGSTLSSDSLSGSPALFHVWSSRDDPAGEGPALAASLQEALRAYRPDAVVVALCADRDDAKAAIRALGSPSAPAWIFVSPSGEIVAYRLGRLSASLAGKAVESLFALYPAASRPAGAAPGAVAAGEAEAAGSIEERVLADLNLGRTRPAAFIDFL